MYHNSIIIHYNKIRTDARSTTKSISNFFDISDFIFEFWIWIWIFLWLRIPSDVIVCFNASLKPIKKRLQELFKYCNLNKKFQVRDGFLKLAVIPNTVRWWSLVFQANSRWWSLEFVLFSFHFPYSYFPNHFVLHKQLYHSYQTLQLPGGDREKGCIKSSFMCFMQSCQ